MKYHKMDQKNGDYAQLIRDCQRSISESANVVVHHSATDNHLPKSNNNRVLGAKYAATSKYQKPSCFSTMEQSEQRARIRNAPVETTKTTRDLTKVAKNYVNSQATQKLNFVGHKPVFRNLQPINVNDSVLELQCAPTASRMKRKPFTSTDRDTTPVLSDYLQPVERLSDQLTHAGLADDFKVSRAIGAESTYLTSIQDVNYDMIAQLFDRLNGI